MLPGWLAVRSLVLTVPVAIALAVGSHPAHCTVINVTGVVTAKDRVVPGARVELSELPTTFERALRAWSDSNENEASQKVLVATKSDDEGAFDLEVDLGRESFGFFELRISHSQYATEVVSLPALEYSIALRPIELHAARPFTFQVNQANGEPAEDALVRVSRFRPPAVGAGANRRPMETRTERSRRLALAARTDSAGRATLQIPDRGTFEVVVVHAGSAPRIQSDNSHQQSVRPHVLRLEQGRTVAIQTRDADGPVSALLRPAGWGVALGKTSRTGRATIWLPADASVELVATTAAGLSDRQMVMAQPEEPPRNPTPVVMTLEQRGWRGVITNAVTGEAVTNAVLWSSREPGLYARSNAAGEVSLPQAQGRFWIAAPGYLRATWSEPEPRGSGEPPLAHPIPLTPVATIELSVRSADGPLQGCEVSLYPADARGAVQFRFLLNARPRVTGPSGTALLAAPSGQFEVRAVANGFTPAFKDVLVDAQDPHDGRIRVELELEPARRVQGLVVNENDDPVAGARIAAGLTVEANMAAMRRVLRNANRKPAVAISDPEGRFEFSGIAADRYDLQVEAEGYAPATLPAVAMGIDPDAPTMQPLPAGSVQELPEIKLNRGYELGGRVIDPEGHPLEGAEVVLISEQSLGVRQRNRERRTTSDSVGRFSFDQLGADLYELVGYAEGFAPSSLDRLSIPKRGRRSDGTESALSDEHVVQLSPALSFQVEIVDGQGNAVAGFASLEPGRDSESAMLHYHHLTRLDRRLIFQESQNGHFRFNSLVAGSYRVEASTRDGRRGSGEIKLHGPHEGREPLLRIPVKRLAQIVGTVSRPDGRVLPGAELRLRDLQGGARVDRARPDGKFAINRPAAGDHELIAMHPDYAPARRRIEGGEESLTVDLVLEDALEISGYVLDATANPVKDVFIRSERLNSAQSGSTLVDSEASTTESGSFSLSGLEPGRYRLWALADGYAPSEIDEIVLEQNLEGLEFVLDQGVSLVGVILGLKPEELARVRVIAHHPGSSHRYGTRSAVADLEGRFTLDGLAPGVVMVEAATEGHERSVAVTLDLSVGAPSEDVVLRFEQGFSLSGIIYRRGEPVSEAFFVLLPNDARRNLVAVGPEGRFHLRHVPEGKHILQVVLSRVGTVHQEEVSLSSDLDLVIEVNYATVRLKAVSAADGSPIEDVQVALRDTQSPLEESMGSSAQLWKTRTGENGRGQVAVVPGAYLLQAGRGGYRVLERSIMVGDADQELLLELEPVSGHTVQLTGSVMAEAQARSGVSLLEDLSGQLLMQGVAYPSELDRTNLLRLPAFDQDTVRLKFLLNAHMPARVAYGEALVQNTNTELNLEEYAAVIVSVPSLMQSREACHRDSLRRPATGMEQPSRRLATKSAGWQPRSVRVFTRPDRALPHPGRKRIRAGMGN